MVKLDDSKSIKVAEDIWWVGFADFEAGFSNNPYLIIDGDEAVLFDPGPGHPFFRDMLLQKLNNIIDIRRIKYIVVHHQDPDLCGLLPYVENMFSPDVVIISHPRTALFLPYYGIRKEILPVGDGDILELKSGRSLVFYHTPYLHFAGSMVTYDKKTKSLFSSDIFAVFDRNWKLYADDSYVDLAKNFIEHYIGSKEAVMYAYNKLSKIEIERILPQHGGIIEKNNVNHFLNLLKEVEPGVLIKELKKYPTKEEEDEIKKEGERWLSYWLNKDVKVKNLNELVNIAVSEGGSTFTNLIDAISVKADELGVTNPVFRNKVHKWNEISSFKISQMYNNLRKTFFKSTFGEINNTEDAAATLQAVKQKLIILFIDIRKFTKWSENKNADDIVNMLNRQHEIMTRIITKYKGRINKIMGDGILAYFNEGNIDNSLKCVIDIHKFIKNSNLLEVGIGIDFGEVIIGDIGESIRVDYTLIGAPVNYASRMCDSADKGEIILTKRAYEKISLSLKETINKEFLVEEIKVKIKPTDPEITGIKIK